MKYLKLFEELTWSDHAAGKFEYYVQGGKGAKELQSIKLNILESMNPPMIDVWESLSDSLLEIKEEWGTFRTKYESNREAIDFDTLELVVDIKKGNYIIAHESDTFYNRGNSTKIIDRTEKEKYRSEKTYDSRLSMYGSNFDQKFYDFYKKNNGKVYPKYNFLIGFESEYVDNNIEKLDEMNSDLVKFIKTAIKRLNGKIVDVNYYTITEGGTREWIVGSNDLSQMKYPRVSVSFIVN